MLMNRRGSNMTKRMPETGEARARKISNQILSSDSTQSVTELHAELQQIVDAYFSLDDECRFYVMHTVAGAKNILARNLLLEILRRDDSVLVRHEAAFALGCIGNRNDIQHLRHVLLNDEHPLVRHEAAMALGVAGTKKDIPALESGLRDREAIVVDSCRAAMKMIELRLSDDDIYGARDD